MKKFFSLVLALVMALSLTTMAWGFQHDVTDAATLATAVVAANVGDTIKLGADIELTAKLNLPTGVTLDGAGYTISIAGTTWDNTNDGKHLLDLGNDTTVKNVTLDSENLAYGVQAYCVTGVKFDNVTIKNSVGAGLTVNGATVEAVNLKASGNAWGSVNVDPGSGVTSESKFTVSGSNTNLADTAGSIWSDGTNVTTGNEVDVTISGGTYAGDIDIPAAAGTAVVSGGTFSTDVSDYVVANSGLVYQNGVYTTTTFVGNTSTLKVADGYAVYELNGGLGTNSATATFTKIVTGNATAADGTVTYTATQYKADNGTVWNEVDVTIADSKLVNTKTGTVVAYLKYAGTSGTKGATSVVATSMVKAPVGTPVCGQYAVDVVMIKGQAYAVDKTATSGQWAVLNGKFITYGAAETAKPHVFTKVNEVNKDSTPANVKCDNCKAVFAVTKDVSAMVSGYVSLGTVAPGYYALIGSTTPVVGGTTTGPVVNSADTFDAGIAMYVGMSVMAAAGSAVVIGKKKD